jgi:hypothetical protein
VPFTLRNLREGPEDVGSNFDGAPDLEFRLVGKALELEESGSGRMKLDDEIVELEEWDVVRVPPGTWRSYESGPDGLDILVFGAPSLGENPRGDVKDQRDWWAD